MTTTTAQQVWYDRQQACGILLDELPRECWDQTGFYRVADDGNIYLAMHNGQQDAIDSDARYTFILSGTQAGKTTIGPCWLYNEIYDIEDEMTGEIVSRGRGSGDYLAVTATYDLFNMKMLPELTRYFCDFRGMGRYHPGPKVMELRDPTTMEFWADTSKDPMWGRIILRSAKTGSGTVGVGRLEAATAKGAWLDECGMDEFSLAAWESVKRRLRIHRGRVLGTTTLYNFGWLRSEIYVPWTQGAEDIRVIQFDSTLNPAFPLDEYEEAKRTMPEWKFNLQYRGVFTRPAGAIYGDFNEARHVIKPFFIPNHWPQVVGIDPGAVHTALLWLGINPDTRDIYAWRESLEGNTTTSEHTRRAKEIGQRFRLIYWYGGAKSETQFRMDWASNGITVKEPMISDVDSGIDKVIALLRGGKFYIFSTCVKTISQMIEYSRVIDSYGTATDKIKDKEKYHLLDALRYAAPGIPKGWSRPGIDQLKTQPIPNLGGAGMGPGGFRL